MKRLTLTFACVVVALVTAHVTPAAAQATPPLPADPAAAAAPQGDRGTAGQLLSDIASDYKNFFSVSNAVWLGVGGAAALGAHEADQSTHEAVLDAGTTTLPGAFTYGSQIFQVPVAAGVWVLGHVTGHSNVAETGRDLLRAQLSVFTWSTAIKWSVQRTRPNGDPRGFPSGHAAASFATAEVVRAHYGWKLGLPAYAVAAYTGVSRITVDEHWVSDVVFGTALGIVCGRTVTVRLRGHDMVVSPVGMRRGAAVMLMTKGPS
jgi:hypothetical protein